ncbi:MAG: hypothetical protein GDA50_04430 [Alphaproteobacteria bacterium GM202ARS2]|nr:hypothetical protein [Alphaproteobacteria bacterium GM202ARS2]
MPHSLSTIFVLAVSYTVVAGLLLLCLRSAALHWRIKIVLFVGVAIFYSVHYVSLKGISGWPGSAPLPAEFRLIAAQIYEPNPVLNSDGTIYLWVSDMAEDVGLTTPRAYQLRYAEALHRRLDTALSRMKSGKPQMGVQNKKTQGADLTAQGPLSAVAESNVTFYDLPSRLLPEK